MTARVTQYEGMEEHSSAYHVFSHTLKGTGESDPRKWLRDALFEFVESL